MMADIEILNELRKIQKDKNNWKNNIEYVAAKLNESYSVEIKAKALWMMGEMGLAHPDEVKKHVDEIAEYMSAYTFLIFLDHFSVSSSILSL